jgi:hypothetical protein
MKIDNFIVESLMIILTIPLFMVIGIITIFQMIDDLINI